MAKKNNSVSISAVDEMIKNNFPSNIIKYDWHGVEIEIKHSLTELEMSKLVDATVSCCFDSETGEYHPEHLMAGKKMNMVIMYTNINTPQDINKLHSWVVNTDIIGAIYEVANEAQLMAIDRAISKAIEYRVASDVRMIYKRIEEIAAELESTVKVFSELFSGITNEDISAVASAVVDTKLDEEKLMEAFNKVSSK